MGLGRLVARALAEYGGSAFFSVLGFCELSVLLRLNGVFREGNQQPRTARLLFLSFSEPGLDAFGVRAHAQVLVDLQGLA